MKITTIMRGREDDRKLHAALLERLRQLQPLIHIDAFHGEHLRILRPRVDALEQQEAQNIMRAYQKGPLDKRAMLHALVGVAEMAAMPLHRYFNAPHASAEVVNYTPSDEARKSARDVLHTALGTLKNPMPIVTDRAPSVDANTLSHARRWWLISPVQDIDRIDVSISIALMQDNRPLAGVVHFPRLGRSYAGAPGAFSFARTGKRTRKIHVKLRDDFRRVAGTTPNNRQTEAFKNLVESHRVKRRFEEASTAYGLCRLAQGSMDLFLNLGMAPQAGVAAAHAVVLGAGGVVIGIDGKDIVYGPAGNVLAVPAFAAGSDEKALKTYYTKRFVA